MKFSDERLEPGSRIALRVEYDGRAFNGWQAQKKHDVPTVQETLEGALSNIASESPQQLFHLYRGFHHQHL